MQKIKTKTRRVATLLLAFVLLLPLLPLTAGAAGNEQKTIRDELYRPLRKSHRVQL